MSVIDDMIEKFNNQNYRVLKPFGSDLSEQIETFFKLLDKKGKLDEIDVTGSAAGDYQNELLLLFHEKYPEKFHYWVNELLSDIEFVNGKPYIVVEPDELSNLFCDSRDYSRESIEKILTGEMDFDWYNDYEINIFDDVIGDLNMKNLTELKNIFVRDLKGVTIEYEDENIEVTAENIEEVFRDSDLVEHILGDYLDGLRFELRSLYFRAEQSALESEYYEEVWGELGEYFDVDKREWVSVRRGYSYDKEGNRKERYIEMVRIPILSNFEKNILDFIKSNKNYGNSGTLEYQGRYHNILAEEFDCLRVRFPDYANSRKIEEQINEMFGDYIS